MTYTSDAFIEKDIPIHELTGSSYLITRTRFQPNLFRIMGSVHCLSKNVFSWEHVLEP